MHTAEPGRPCSAGFNSKFWSFLDAATQVLALALHEWTNAALASPPERPFGLNTKCAEQQESLLVIRVVTRPLSLPWQVTSTALQLGEFIAVDFALDPSILAASLGC